MVRHELKIGQRIYDIHDDRWGEILLIGRKDEDTILKVEDTDVIITYKPDDSTGENETFADCAYPLVPDKTFKGEAVCDEIHCEAIKYPYYCPFLDENVFCVEID